jgi:hypothetical protein
MGPGVTVVSVVPTVEDVVGVEVATVDVVVAACSVVDEDVSFFVVLEGAGALFCCSLAVFILKRFSKIDCLE